MDEPFTMELNVRFHDLDAQGHVNNAVFLTYMEELRSAFFETVVEERMSTVTVRSEVEYVEPIETDGVVHVGLHVADIGETSIEFEYNVASEGSVAARGRTIQVVIDSETGDARPVPPGWRRRLDEYVR